MNVKTAVAVFGGGCFWCTEAIFQGLKGVLTVEPGYSGGTVSNPTYAQVSSGLTGHAEATRIEFDPAIITFDELLAVFFETHDPTSLNKQGNDVGNQYRSVVFYSNVEQKKATEKFIASYKSKKPIVTEIKPLNEFFKAEEYHTNYFLTHPDEMYCRFIIAPKLQHLSEKFAGLVKSETI